MGRNIVSAKLDIIFKKIFTDNEDMLLCFISEILDIKQEDLQEVTIVNNEMTPESAEGKFSRLDLNLKMKDQLVNVEIQVKSENDYRDRTLFYWAKLYTLDLKSGESYGQLKKAIAVNIINFNMFDRKDYHTEVQATIKGTEEVFTDKFSIHFFELKKVGKKLDPNNRKELWLQFLNAESEEDFEMLKEANVPIITKAVNVIYDISEDAQIRELARLREKALRDEASALYNAEQKGIKQGEQKAKEELIRKMRLTGMTEEQIHEILNA